MAPDPVYSRSVIALAQVVFVSVQRSTLGVSVTAAGMGSNAW